MRKLTFLTGLLVVAALAWGGYWWAGATAMERGFSAWLEARRAAGWVAEAETIETHGFPNRFDTTFTKLELADPVTKVAWSAPWFQILSLSYRPSEVIAVWPDTQTLATPDEVISVASGPMRASIALDANPSLPLERTTVEVIDARFSSTAGWQTALAAGQLSMRRTPQAVTPASYDLFLHMQDFTPDAGFLAVLPAAARLPAVIAAVRVNGTVEFDKPWDRSAIEQARPQPRRIFLEGLRADWGDLALRATGTLDVAPDGQPTGTIDVQATNWREMIEIARQSGALAPEYVAPVTRGLEMLAALSGDPETLQVPVSFRAGRMLVGPVPVAAAPLLLLP